MFAHLHRQGTHPSMPASKAGTRLRRAAAALAAVTAGLLASAAAIPAAFARDIPDPLPGGQYPPAYPAPVLGPTVHAVTAGGVAGWQIALIALGAALIAAAVTIVLVRARAAHRPPPDPLARLVRHTSPEPGPQPRVRHGPGLPDGGQARGHTSSRAVQVPGHQHTADRPDDSQNPRSKQTGQDHDHVPAGQPARRRCRHRGAGCRPSPALRHWRAGAGSRRSTARPGRPKRRVRWRAAVALPSLPRPPRGQPDRAPPGLAVDSA